MKTNITTDNYEAYLLDYMESNLSPEGAKELKAFVETQGLNWSEVTEELPKLESPQIEYRDKEGLRKHRSIVPLYVKIASAAAAAGLLLTVGLWPEKSMQKIEPIAELKPIQNQLILVDEPLHFIPKRTVQFVGTQPIEKLSTEPIQTGNNVVERPEILALVELPSIHPKETQIIQAVSEREIEVRMEMLRYRLESELAFANLNNEAFEEEMPTSFIGRTIYRWSEGRYASINDLVNAGLHRTKQEITTVTDMAKEAQQRTEEYLADMRENWKGEWKE